MCPTYEYVCDKCAKTSELFVSLKHRPDFINCEHCPGNAKLGMSTGQPPILQGTGWARDGYTGSSNRKWVGGDGED